MLFNKKIVFYILPLTAVLSCTKLTEHLGSTLTNQQAANALGPDPILNAAYSDLATPFHNQDQVFSLEENTSDESLVPTRGGDWDDNGVWRVLHAHTWDPNHGQILSVFNNLNKLQYDATNVLTFNPSTEKAAEARFLRAMSLYYLLDLYGQYPYRQPGDNLLNAPVVKSGADAIGFIISELTAIIPQLDVKNPISKANPDAATVLLMRALLNKGAFINRAAPTFDAGDMQQVITLGTAIMNSGKYSYTPEYFDNFAVNNSSLSKEGIFAYPNASGVSANHGAIEGRWNMTLHYNSYDKLAPNAGWNGFSTVSDFYNTFAANGQTVTYSPTDAAFDKRIGLRPYAGVTDISGIRPGMLVGQQVDENGNPEKDRKGNPLAFTPQIDPSMKETGANLEITGIRVIKYLPDFAHYGGPAGNWLMMMRYPEVVLMVAEAKMRTGDMAGGLALVNQLRTARGAGTLASISLVNPSNVDDPSTLLAERGRELYWESLRRTDLIRFGVYTKPWQLKPTDDAHYLVFPIPSQALSANPNLKQNPGYGQ